MVNEVNAQSLSLAGWQAHFLRDNDALAQIGNRLLDLSVNTEQQGLFFSALSKKSQNPYQAKNELENLLESSSQNIRNAANLMLGGYYCSFKGDLKSASTHNMKAAQVALKKENYLIYFVAQQVTSLILSINGNHRRSLDILRELRPIADWLGLIFPTAYFDFYNSVAYELFQLGECRNAHHIITKVCASHLKTLRPEWEETKREIEQVYKPKLRLRMRGWRPEPKVSISTRTVGSNDYGEFRFYRGRNSFTLCKFPIGPTIKLLDEISEKLTRIIPATDEDFYRVCLNWANEYETIFWNKWNINKADWKKLRWIPNIIKISRENTSKQFTEEDELIFQKITTQRKIAV